MEENKRQKTPKIPSLLLPFLFLLCFRERERDRDLPCVLSVPPPRSAVSRQTGRQRKSDHWTGAEEGRDRDIEMYKLQIGQVDYPGNGYARWLVGYPAKISVFFIFFFFCCCSLGLCVPLPSILGLE